MEENKLEKILKVIQDSLFDLAIEIRANGELKRWEDREEPTPLMSFDDYVNRFLPHNDDDDYDKNDKCDNKIVPETPRFEYDYGFNPLIYLANKIKEKSAGVVFENEFDSKEEVKAKETVFQEEEKFILPPVSLTDIMS